MLFYEVRENGKRKEISLGKDYILAVQQWAKLEQSKIHAHDSATYHTIATRYKAEILPQAKSHNTYITKKTAFQTARQLF